ncbi:uncharacterized protein AMSG_03903 [Thecamonas trahens ATCC 50062]|uniref:RING-type E3 ubiquitin transferase n=1 Tax=Thecamonas trahens ATCC 50062 TaxID=461836 RepID=A0A0L0D5M5_THETB|nr:hypothetical protein AMSG_03903 [Thecamonas trahens ATCC 50062]KNC47672.1 hypothetical protein AMSG_03903 [Thecamonas trahens ATCC 50062]|eukprot:XP_013759156.1 hypothetical protein AMSG_03903 [Thecamonas trahens ATCC 50062]
MTTPGEMFHVAAPERVLRARQKDGQHVSELRGRLEELVRGMVGGRASEAAAGTVSLVASLVYYGLTKGLCQPSVGEEYGYVLATRSSAPLEGIVPAAGPLSAPGRVRAANGSIKWAPSDVPLVRMWLALLLKIVAPLLVARADVRAAVARLIGAWVDRHWPLIQRLAAAVIALHEAWFFAVGSYASIADRLLGIVHADVAPSTSHLARTRNQGYVGMAVLHAIPPAIDLVSALRTLATPPAGESTDDSEHVRGAQLLAPEIDCPICFEDMSHNVSATLCGHVACWDCLIQFTASDACCPTCRAPTKPSDVVRLYNY